MRDAARRRFGFLSIFNLPVPGLDLTPRGVLQNRSRAGVRIAVGAVTLVGALAVGLRRQRAVAIHVAARAGRQRANDRLARGAETLGGPALRGAVGGEDELARAIEEAARLRNRRLLAEVRVAVGTRALRDATSKLALRREHEDAAAVLEAARLRRGTRIRIADRVVAKVVARALGRALHEAGSVRVAAGTAEDRLIRAVIDARAVGDYHFVSHLLELENP
jgi:hypothetical protein